MSRVGPWTMDAESLDQANVTDAVWTSFCDRLVILRSFSVRWPGSRARTPACLQSRRRLNITVSSRIWFVMDASVRVAPCIFPSSLATISDLFSACKSIPRIRRGCQSSQPCCSKNGPEASGELAFFHHSSTANKPASCKVHFIVSACCHPTASPRQEGKDSTTSLDDLPINLFLPRLTAITAAISPINQRFL